MKKLKISALIVICVFCMLLFYKYAFKVYYEVNEELPDNLTSGKSLAEYAVNVVEEHSGKEFNVGEVYMTLDSELKGEVQVTLVEKKEKNLYWLMWILIQKATNFFRSIMTAGTVNWIPDL